MDGSEALTVAEHSGRSTGSGNDAFAGISKTGETEFPDSPFNRDATDESENRGGCEASPKGTLGGG